MSKIILALYVITTSLGLIVLKYGTKAGLPVSYIDNKLNFNINFYTVTGLSLYAVSFLLYIYLISKNDLGYIIPLAAAFVYIMIFAGSFIVFKESFTAFKLIGIAMIVGGLIFLNLGK